MNVPPNTREFSLELAQAGNPLVTRDSRCARFIAYVAEAKSPSNRIIALVDGNIATRCIDGKNWDMRECEHDLFLAPLGYCQGLPVFTGDKLTRKGSDTEYTAEPDDCNFDSLKWPSKLPVIGTKINHDDMCSIYYNGGPVNGYKEETLGWYRIANKAIERSIADGDVIPTSEIVQLMCDAYNKHYSSAVSFQCVAESVVSDYLKK